MSAPSAAWLAAFGTALLGMTIADFCLSATAPVLTLSQRALSASVSGLVASALLHALESSRAQRASWHASRACRLSERSARISALWGPSSWVRCVWIALVEELHLRRAEALSR